MEKYIKLISMSFQRSIAYRVEYFTSILNAFLYIFIFTSVWRVLIPEGETMNGLSRSDMIAYAVLSTLIKASMGRNDSLIGQRVRSGEIAVDLMKPYSLPVMYLSDTIGSSLFQIVSRGAPLLIFCYLFFDLDLGVDLATLLRFVPVYIAGFILFFLMAFWIGSTSFFLVDIFPVWIFYWSMVTLASGAIIPLNFFPAGFSGALNYTPFPYLFYFPTMVILNKSIGMTYAELLIRYGVICVALLLAANGTFRIGLRKLTIAGG
jgi:ABC-2 type transport system permease protein